MDQLHMEAEPQEEPPVAQFKLESYIDKVDRQMDRSIKLMEKRLKLQQELDMQEKFKELAAHNKKVDANLEQEIKRIEMERMLEEKALFNYIYGGEAEAPPEENKNAARSHVARYMNAKQQILTEAHKQHQKMETSFQSADLKNQYITRCEMKKQEIAMNESMGPTHNLNRFLIDQVMNMDTLNLETETNGSERPEPEGEMTTEPSASTIPGVGKGNNGYRSGNGSGSYGHDPMRRSGYTPLARSGVDRTGGMSSNHFEKAGTGTRVGKENKDFVDDGKSNTRNGGVGEGVNGGETCYERKSGGLSDYDHGLGVFLPSIQGTEELLRPEVNGTTPTINGEPEDKAGQERAPENANYAPAPYEGRSHVRTSSGRQRVRGPLGRGHGSQSPDVPVTRGGITLSGTRHREREDERDIICHSRSTAGVGEIVADIEANLMEDDDAAPSNTRGAQLNITRKNENGKRRRSTLTKYDDMVKKMRDEGYHAHNRLYAPMNHQNHHQNRPPPKTPVVVCMPEDADVHEYVPESPPAHGAGGGVEGASINTSPTTTNPKSPGVQSFVTERAFPMTPFGASGQQHHQHQRSVATIATTLVEPPISPIDAFEPYLARDAQNFSPLFTPAPAPPAPIASNTTGTLPRLIPIPVLPPTDRSLSKVRADMRGPRLRSPMLQSPRELLCAHNMMLHSDTCHPGASIPMGNSDVVRAHTTPPPLQRGGPTAATSFPAAAPPSEDYSYSRNILPCGCEQIRSNDPPHAPILSALSAYRGGPRSPPPNFRADNGAREDEPFTYGCKCEEHSEYLATMRGANVRSDMMRGMGSSDNNNDNNDGRAGEAAATGEEATFVGEDTTGRGQSLPPRFVDAPQGIRSPRTARSQVDQTRPMGIKAHLRIRFPISSGTDGVRPLRVGNIEPRQLPTPATPQLDPMPCLRAPQVFPQNVCRNNGGPPARGIARQPITLAASRMRDVRLPLAEPVQRQAHVVQNTAVAQPSPNAQNTVPVPIIPKVIPDGAIIYRYNSKKELVPKEREL